MTNSDSSGNTHYIVKDSGLIKNFTTLMKNFKSSFDFFGAFSSYGKMKQDIINYKVENSIEYEKLKIVKIESGSLLSIILGDKNIIEAIGLLLNKTINLIFNKYTQEGKIYRQNELARTLKETVELGEELKKVEYDISSSEENIEKTFANLLEINPLILYF